MVHKLSIIIPTLNEEKYLPKLLDSIVNQKFFGDLEVIVIDGNSEDATVSVAKSYSKKLDIKVINSARGVGRQRNLGASVAQHETLLFIDADVSLTPRLLDKLCLKASTEGPFISQVTHLSTEKLNISDILFLIVIHGLLAIAWIIRTPAINGDFILTNKQTFKMLNGFVEDAVLGEDILFGLSAYRKGAKYRFYPLLAIRVSPRRVRTTGRIKLLLLWARGFMHVRKYNKAIYRDEGFKYTFGKHS